VAGASEARIGELRVVVLRGDITKVSADAIVNPANSLMIMGGGVAGAIKRAGGEEIEREAMGRAPVPIGAAIVTGAGRLGARYIIHAPTMERPAMATTPENVYLAARAALLKAKELGLNSVAFPGLGTGVGGLPYDEAARAMLRAIAEFKDSPHPRQVLLVAYDEQLYRAFRRRLREVSEGPGAS
jgi:O-acetyl-ADP-ribose deacetylase (regulator of RNase III)